MRMLYWPLRSPLGASSRRFPGGTRRSSRLVQLPRWPASCERHRRFARTSLPAHLPLAWQCLCRRRKRSTLKMVLRYAYYVERKTQRASRGSILHLLKVFWTDLVELGYSRGCVARAHRMNGSIPDRWKSFSRAKLSWACAGLPAALHRRRCQQRACVQPRAEAMIFRRG